MKMLRIYLGEYPTDCEFADDNFTVSESEQNLQKLINNLVYYSEGANHVINTKKTQLMANKPATISVNGTILEQVPFYKDLGSYINPECSLDKELNVRIGKAWG